LKGVQNELNLREVAISRGRLQEIFLNYRQDTNYACLGTELNS
jgi:hypothetical protein